jgi:hypothetical protein
MKRILMLAALPIACLFLNGLALGQERSFKTDNGCSVVMTTNAPIEQPVQWTGRCVNGLASGVGILSYQFDTDSLGKARWHVKTMLTNGKENGVSWLVADPAIRQSNDATFNMNLYIRRNGERLSRKSLQTTDSLDQSLQTADALANEAQGLGLPTMSADVLKIDIRQWYQNPSQYTGGASTSNMASNSSVNRTSQATSQPTTTSNQTSPSSSGNITAECDQEQSRIISKATADAKALVATGDLAGMQRIQLVRNIAMRDLYSGGRCSGANNATARREQAQHFINMDQRFCQQWGMGSQCAAPPVLAANKSTSTASSNSQGESSSNATGKQSIERVDRCIDIRNTHVQGNDAQWYRVTNTCPSAIKFYSANNSSDRYGNLKNLAPGQTDTSWWSLRTKSSLPWVACPEKSPNGKDVRLDESNANSLACFYYN